MRADSPEGREYCADLLARLVNIQSVYPDEEQVMLFLESELRSKGVEPQRIAVQGNRFNILCSTGTGGPRVCLCAHADTVPPSGASIAQARLDGDNLYGLGSCDDKASIAAMTTAFFDIAARNPRGTLDLLITVDEEVDAQGARSAVEQGYKCDYAIVGEPTSLDIVNAHPGLLFLTFTTRGVASHGSMPENGVNAIERMMTLIEEVRSLLADCPSHPQIGGCSLNLGEIHAGDRPNRVPDECTARVDVRLVPPITVSQMLAGIQSVLDDKEWASVVVDKQGEALDTALDSPLVKAIEGAAQDLADGPGHHLRGQVVGWRAWTEAEPFQTMLGIPAVVIGPGDLKLAHTSEEHVSIFETQSAARLYVEVVERLWK